MLIMDLGYDVDMYLSTQNLQHITEWFWLRIPRLSGAKVMFVVSCWKLPLRSQNFRQ